MAVVKELGWIRLLVGVSGDAVYHIGTGELVHLPERWRLTYAPNGACLLEHKDDFGIIEAKWCREVLKWSLRAVSLDSGFTSTLI